MAETFPTPLEIDVGVADALAGSMHQRTQIQFLPDPCDENSSPTLKQQYNRIEAKIRRALTAAFAGMCYKYGTLQIAACPMRYRKSDGTEVNFEGGTLTLTSSNTNYVYILHSTNVLTKSTVGWPADRTTFTPLAEYECGGSDITTSDEDADRRGYALYHTNASSSSPTGTTSTTFTVDDDNAGAGATTQVRFNRGSDNAEDAALEWDEANDRFNARAQDTTATLAPVNGAAFKVAGTDVIAADGDLEAASIATDQLYVFGANGGTALGVKLTPSGSSGAPSSGAHTAGELAVDTSGVIYVCVTGGTPGTWQQIGKQDGTVVLSISNGTAASAGNPSDVTLQAQDQYGVNIAAALLLRILLMDDVDGAAYAANVTAFSVTTGTLTRTITANKEYIIKTNGSGQAVIRITNSIADDVYILADVAPGSRPMDCRDTGQATWT